MMADMTLNDGRAMPRLGLGTYEIPDSQVAAVVRSALDAGFAMIDTAPLYHNERGVGDGIKASAAFVITKLWNTRHADADDALDESLALLGVEAVDLYLIHWPRPMDGLFVDAWRALVRARDAGKARSIGVSNFLPEHITAVVDATGVVPAVNQIECQPRFQQRALCEANAALGIVTQCWSPLGKGDVLGDPAVTAVAERVGATPAQVVLAWHLAHGRSAIPKASDAAHQRENVAAQDVTLAPEDLAAIDALDDPDGRIGPEPLTY